MVGEVPLQLLTFCACSLASSVLYDTAMQQVEGSRPVGDWEPAVQVWHASMPVVQLCNSVFCQCVWAPVRTIQVLSAPLGLILSQLHNRHWICSKSTLQTNTQNYQSAPSNVLCVTFSMIARQVARGVCPNVYLCLVYILMCLACFSC